MAASLAGYGHRKLFASSEELHRLLLLATLLRLLGLFGLLRFCLLTTFCHDMPLGGCWVARFRIGFSFRFLRAARS